MAVQLNGEPWKFLCSLLGKLVALGLQFLGAGLQRLALGFQGLERLHVQESLGLLRVSRRAMAVSRSLRRRRMSSITGFLSPPESGIGAPLSRFAPSPHRGDAPGAAGRPLRGGADTGRARCGEQEARQARLAGSKLAPHRISATVSCGWGW